MNLFKYCPKCQLNLPGVAFSPRYKDKPDYLHSWGKECVSTSLKAWHKNHPSLNPLAKTLREYFDKYLTPGDPDDCWEWRGSRNPNGYGITCFQRKRQGSHVVA